MGGFGIGNIDTGAPIMTNVLYKTEGAGASVVLENNITENALYIALFANPATGGMEAEPYVVDAATSSMGLLAVDVASGSLAKAVSFDVENGLPEPVTVGNTRFMAVAAQGQSFLASLGAPGTRMSVEWKVAFNVSMMAHPKQAIVFLEGVAGDVLIVTVSNPFLSRVGCPHYVCSRRELSHVCRKVHVVLLGLGRYCYCCRWRRSCPVWPGKHQHCPCC